MSTADYLSLLDWTARQTHAGEGGATPKQFAPLFDRPGITAEIWCRLVKDFGKLFSVVAGQPQRIDEPRSKTNPRRYRTRHETRELLASVTMLVGFVPGLPLPDGEFDVVLSKDFLHHLPDPVALWYEIRRLARPGAFVCVMDLCRPDTTSVAHQIVESVAADDPEVLKTDFYNSLLAAFTPDEILKQLQTADLDLNVTLWGDRHLLIQGFVA